MRPAVERVKEEVLKDTSDIIFFTAPTGYGKTSLVPNLLEDAMNKLGVEEIVHVLPLRAVIEQVFERASRKFKDKDITVGYQAHGLRLGSKSPFMASNLVITTFDSFLLNMIRVNVAEKGLGHYEVPRGFVFTSIVVLDEVHLPYMESGDKAMISALTSAIAMLVKGKVPVITESATLPSQVIHNIMDGKRNYNYKIISPVPPNFSDKKNENFIQVEDRDFYDKLHSVIWKIDILCRPADQVIEEKISTSLRVFRRVSKVEEAVETYDKLARKYGEEQIALIHGRMTPKDREANFLKIEKGKALAIVGTKALDAGADFTADTLIGDPMDIASLLQAAGRINRYLENEMGEILIVQKNGFDAYTLNMLRDLKDVNPRSPYNYKGIKGYLDVLEKYFWGDKPDVIIEDIDFSLMESTGDRKSIEEKIEELSQRACGLVRNKPLIPVIPSPHDVGMDSHEELLKNITDYVFTLDLDKLVRMQYEKGILEKEGRQIKAIVLKSTGDKRTMGLDDLEIHHSIPVEIDFDIQSSKQHCPRIMRQLEKYGVVALQLKEKSYRAGRGLV